MTGSAIFYPPLPAIVFNLDCFEACKVLSSSLSPYFLESCDNLVVDTYTFPV